MENRQAGETVAVAAEAEAEDMEDVAGVVGLPRK